MEYVKGKYLGSLTGDIDGVEVRLHVWTDPADGRMFAVDNMEIDAAANYANDPYCDHKRIVFENTFSGLPK